MSDLKAAGGIELEVYRRPGFLSTTAVRRSEVGYGGSGFEVQADPEPYEDEE